MSDGDDKFLGRNFILVSAPSNIVDIDILDVESSDNGLQPLS